MFSFRDLKYFGAVGSLRASFVSLFSPIFVSFENFISWSMESFWINISRVVSSCAHESWLMFGCFMGDIYKHSRWFIHFIRAWGSHYGCEKWYLGLTQVFFTLTLSCSNFHHFYTTLYDFKFSSSSYVFRCWLHMCA